MLEFTKHYPNVDLGYLPQFADPANPEHPVDQINRNYAHGGGWHTFRGFELGSTDGRYHLSYPGDPPMKELARAWCREYLIVLFEHEWVAVINPTTQYVNIAHLD